MPITPLSDDGRDWPYIFKTGSGAIQLDQNWIIDRFMVGPAGRGYHTRPGFMSPGCMECTGTLYRYINTATTGDRTIENNKHPMGGPYYFHSGEWRISSGKLTCPNGIGTLFFPFSWKETWQESVVFHVQENAALDFTGVVTYPDYNTVVAKQPERVFYFDFIDFDNHHKIVEKWITRPLGHGTAGITPSTILEVWRRVRLYKVTDGAEELIGEQVVQSGYASDGRDCNVALQIRYIEKNRWKVLHNRGLPRPSTSVQQQYYYGVHGVSANSEATASFNTKLHGGMWAGFGYQNPDATPSALLGLVGYHIFQGRIRKDSSGKPVPYRRHRRNFLGGQEERQMSLMVGNIAPVTRSMNNAALRNQYNLWFQDENHLEASPYATPKELGVDLGDEVAGWIENTAANEMQIEFDGLESWPSHPASQDYSIFGLGVHNFTKTYCTDCESLNGVTLIARRDGMQDYYNANVGSNGAQNPYFFLSRADTFSLFHGIDAMLPCQGFTTTFSANNGGFGPPTMFFTSTRTLWWSALAIQPSAFSDPQATTPFWQGEYHEYLDGGGWRYTKNGLDIMTMVFVPQTAITTPDQGYLGPPNDPMANWTTHWFYTGIPKSVESDPPDPHYPIEQFAQKYLDVRATGGFYQVSDSLNLRAVSPIDTDTLTQYTPYTNPTPIVSITTSNSNHLLNRERSPCNLSVARIILTPIYDFEDEEPEALPWIESELPDVEPLPEPDPDSES